MFAAYLTLYDSGREGIKTMANRTWNTARKLDSDAIACFEKVAAKCGLGDNWSISVHFSQQGPVPINGQCAGCGGCERQ